MLLASASYGGTLAAARQLGAEGFEVGVISSARLDAAAWSKFTDRTHHAPPERDTERFLGRLLEIGAAKPGQILLATSDETAWLYTANAARLSQYFLMYQPSIQCMQRILDKKLFADAATRAGLNVLPSWIAHDADELALLAPALPYPILLKPRTHVHRLNKDKGVVAHSAAQLIEAFPYFVEREKARAADDPLMPDSSLPLLQQFVRVADEGVCSVSGFIDRSGELFVTRRATKVFQRLPPVGTGICFKSLPPDSTQSELVRRLCRELDYFGMFEVEFIKFNDGWAVIDFNPRLFGQAGMDIRRGMPLPLLACLEAAGKTAELREAVAKAQAVRDDELTLYCDRFTLWAILTARRLTGRISRDELAYWRGWSRQGHARLVDVAVDEQDPMPGRIHALSELSFGLKALPRFLRLTPRTPGRVDAAASIAAKS